MVVLAWVLGVQLPAKEACFNTEARRRSREDKEAIVPVTKVKLFKATVSPFSVRWTNVMSH